MITPDIVLNQATQAAIADLTTPPDSALSAEEREQLAVCEATIAAEQQSFYVLGAAIRQVRDGKLYRENFDTIEAYGESRWDLKRSYLYQHIDAANVADNLRPVTETLPVNEFQTRQLAPLSPDDQRRVWLHVLENARGATVTAKMVHAAVTNLVPAPEEEDDSEDTPEELPVLPQGVVRTIIISDITSDQPHVAADKLRERLSHSNLSFAEDCHVLVVCHCADNRALVSVLEAFDFDVGTHLNWEQPTLRRPVPWSFCRAEIQILHGRRGQAEVSEEFSNLIECPPAQNHRESDLPFALAMLLVKATTGSGETFAVAGSLDTFRLAAQQLGRTVISIRPDPETTPAMAA